MNFHNLGRYNSIVIIVTVQSEMMIERKGHVLMLYKIITKCSHAQTEACKRGWEEARGLIYNCCELNRIILTLKRTHFLCSCCAFVKRKRHKSFEIY